MRPEVLAEVVRRAHINEGTRLLAYDDAQPDIAIAYPSQLRGTLTIGIGHSLQSSSPIEQQYLLKQAGIQCAPNLTSLCHLSITVMQAEALFRVDLPKYAAAARALLTLGTFDALNDARQVAFFDLVYNEGGSDFTRTWALLSHAQAAKSVGNLAIAHGLFVTVGDHLRASAWYGQVGNRAKRDIAMLVTGQLCSATGDGSDVLPG
jgi:hypothetical protein